MSVNDGCEGPLVVDEELDEMLKYDQSEDDEGLNPESGAGARGA